MKRFAFPLEQLLRLKHWKEEEAKKALAAEVEALERLKSRLEETRGELAGLLGSTRTGDEGETVDVPVRVGILQYAGHLGGVIAARQGDIAAQGTRLKAASDRLLKAMQERKALEKLKERRREEHRREAGKLAYANLDEASAGLLRRAGARAAEAGAGGPEDASDPDPPAFRDGGGGTASPSRSAAGATGVAGTAAGTGGP